MKCFKLVILYAIFLMSTSAFAGLSCSERCEKTNWEGRCTSRSECIWDGNCVTERTCDSFNWEGRCMSRSSSTTCEDPTPEPDPIPEPTQLSCSEDCEKTNWEGRCMSRSECIWEGDCVTKRYCVSFNWEGRCMARSSTTTCR